MTGEKTDRPGRLRRSRVALTLYFRRLLSPPLPGDGLLLFGFLEGVVGWGLSWAFSRNPGLAPFGLVQSIVAVWIVLTAGIVFFGVTYTSPTVRRNRVWLIWGGLNVAATVVNVGALVGVVPPAVERYAYWHPWLAAIGIGYLITALYNWESPQIRQQERVVYAVTGVATLGLLAGSLGPLRAFVTLNIFAIGAVVHLVPIGHDVLADAALIARRQ
ncbi:hypothetical protein [Halorubrum sp. 2020YC2]|uniref:hypothetical protein n=1 Tax=Halorubrum sp. 2020YC2 TaxID=2836432 RepID=UPI001BE56E2D|nr:hypothetical protein [Halorubrum sp. 2020YC2]QWC20330.1 hypothetical protein KI388_05115 [Halorubrum sp. 2020YC2]